MRKRSMHTANGNHESGKKDMVWVLLAECSLDELMRLAEGTGEPAAGWLFQDLGIPRECLTPIIRAGADFAQQAMMHAHPGTPAVIRWFCQEKLLRAEDPVETMRPRPAVAGPGITLQAHPKMSGGWGYFLVERNGDFPQDRRASSPNLVDLYLYREGK